MPSFLPFAANTSFILESNLQKDAAQELVFDMSFNQISDVSYIGYYLPFSKKKLQIKFTHVFLLFVYVFIRQTNLGFYVMYFELFTHTN